MCLAGAVVAFWSLKQEVAGWQVQAFYCNDKYFCHWIQWKHLAKTQISWTFSKRTYSENGISSWSSKLDKSKHDGPNNQLCFKFSKNRALLETINLICKFGHCWLWNVINCFSVAWTFVLCSGICTLSSRSNFCTCSSHIAPRFKYASYRTRKKDKELWECILV